jgi:hypothetical protein
VAYWLPNHKELLDNKKANKLEYEERTDRIDEDINENLCKFSFLHDILTETGENLVKALINYMSWLGFSDVIEYDSTNHASIVLEEDIQIPIKEGLLIIECKGIGGTSTDADCSQISKIKHRMYIPAM